MAQVTLPPGFEIVPSAMPSLPAGFELVDSAPAKATAPPASATIGMIAPSSENDVAQPFGSLGIKSVSDADWSKLSPQDKMTGVLKAAGYAMGFGKDPVDNPKTTLATAAVPAIIQLASKAAPGVLDAGQRLAGISKARAGANIEAATQAAGDVPLVTDNVAAAGQRAAELQAAGARPARAVTLLMRRIADPEAEPLTFQEARDFYSNISRLSANEFGNLNPAMQRQVGAVKEALGQALTDAAGTAGAGEQYAQGMTEYAKAGRAAAKWNDTYYPLLKKAILGTAGALGAGKAAHVGWDLLAK